MAVLLALALASTVMACTSDDDDSSSGDGEGATHQAAQASPDSDDEDTTTTVGPDEPSAAKPDDVVPFLEDLLSRYDAAVNTIVADPSLADDETNAPVEDFLALFPDGSSFAAGSIQGWVEQSERGVTLEPLAAGGAVNTTSLEGPPTRIDDDTILFGQCTVQSYVVRENGHETSRQERKLLPGNGQAVRVDGHWRLQEITTPPDVQGCVTRGGA
jgi:hypothetical protein